MTIAEELLRELQNADAIISNALQIMSLKQLEQWARANRAVGLVECGAARCQERSDLIARAEQECEPAQRQGDHLPGDGV